MSDREHKPPGLYEELVTKSASDLIAKAGEAAVATPLPANAAAEVIARHLRDYLERAFASIPAASSPQAQLEVANQLLDVVRHHPHTARFWDDGDCVENSLLSAIRGDEGFVPTRPHLPLSESALYVNANREYRFGAALELEIASADEIDFICAFVFWEGYRQLRPAIARFLERGGKMRVITTTYRAMTESRVLDELVDLGAQVKVSYNAMATRLHAKAWLLERHSGFSTAFVGSSNLSKTALSPGLEWNVRLSEVENKRVLDEFRAAFGNYWEDTSEFEDYDPERFARETAAQRRGDALLSVFELRARPFQQVILDRLMVERDVHNRHRNLVVAATGTGKTVIAALDYRQLCERTGSRPPLLFVAHRESILQQARDKYRHALGDGSFGERLVDGQRPADWTHVFASVQSLARLDVAAWERDRFAVIVVDEFHHAEARTYQAILRLEPDELLGLTATPERTDGVSVTHWFDGRVAAEVRLWDAIDRGFLVPFHYYAVADGTDLDALKWRAGRYDTKELTKLFVANHARTHLVLKAVQSYVREPQRMRALGFCASVEHAEWMARAFNDAGLPSEVIIGTTPTAARRQAVAKLKNGELKCIFTRDVFNEGVDIPEADTILFLRPTESSIVFLQQLGRGLRRAGGKRCLTVLDFVGRPHRRFRYDMKLRAMVGKVGRGTLLEHIEEEFPFLPSGCTIKLDRQSRDHVLENLRRGIGNDKRSLLGELRELAESTTLSDFLRETDLELGDIYRNKRCWSELKRAAGHPVAARGPDHEASELEAGIANLIHVDDRVRLRSWLGLLSREHPPAPATSKREARLRLMLATNVLDLEAGAAPDEALATFWRHPALRAEVTELLSLLDDRLDHTVVPFRPHHAAPFAVHATYRLSEIMAGLGDVRDGVLYRPRGLGVHYDAPSKSNVLMVTLTKDEKNRKASTMYKDYAITPRRFHWESQSGTAPHHEKGKRHIQHRELGVTPLLFVRETARDDRRQANPYVFLGPAALESTAGDRPMRIVWGLEHPMPAGVYAKASVVS